LLHVFVGVSRETWWVGDGLECVSPPLLVVVGIGVSRETIPLMERILLVAPPCFTWNIGISTSNISRAYSRVYGSLFSCWENSPTL